MARHSSGGPGSSPGQQGEKRHAALYKLHAWLSPAYPVGAYTYSHGLEWAIEAGLIQDSATALSHIQDCLEHGAGRTDAIILAHAWRAGRDDSLIEDLAELALALAPSAERLMETEAQGVAFAEVTAAAWGEASPAPYPIAVGRAAAAHDVPLEEALVIYLQAFTANLVSAAVRLVPLGQTEGAKIVARLMPVVQRVAKDSVNATLDDIGGCALGADIASMQHETQVTRLFRS